MQRTLRTMVTGILPNQQLQAEEASGPTTLGVLVVLAALRWMRERSRREMDRATRVVVRLTRTGTIDTDAKREITASYVAWRVADFAVKATGRSLARPHRRLATRLECAFRTEADVALWLAFAIRDADTLRLPALTDDELKPPAPTPVVRRSGRFAGRTAVRRLGDAYITTRSSTPMAAPEHRTKQPFGKLHDRVMQQLPRVVLATPAGRNMGAALRDALSGGDWATVVGFYKSLPTTTLLTLLAARLLVSRSATSNTTHSVDFVAEKMLSQVVDDLLEERLSAAVSRLGPDEQTRMVRSFAARLSVDIAHATAVGLGIGRHFMWRSAQQPHLQEFAASSLAEGSVRAVLLPGVDLAGIRRERRAAIEAVAARLRECEGDVGTVDVVVAFAEHVERRALLHLLRSALEDVAPLRFNIHQLIVDEPELVLRMMLQRFPERPHVPAVQVAIPVAGWTSPLNHVAPPQLEPLAAVLERRDCADALTPDDSRRQAIVFSVDVEPGRTDLETAARARVEGDGVMAAVWFLGDTRFRTDLAASAILLAGGKIRYQQWTPGAYQFSTRRLDDSDAQQLSAILAAVLPARTDPRLRAVWSRVIRAIGFFKRSKDVGEPHESYLYLWLSAESLLANLDSDIKSQIGTLVAYRIGLLCPPDHHFAGRTYEQYRWAVAAELDALYNIRCRVVHEGAREVPVDDVLLARFSAYCRTAIYAAAHHVLKFGLDRLDDLLAWHEHHHPGNSVIIAQPRTR